MVSYFVIGADGSKYGPADEFVLQEWVAQNRLTSTTELEDARTGERILAGYVPELRFPNAERLAPQPAAASAAHMPSQPQPAPFMPQSAAPYRPGQQAQGVTPYYRASQMVAVEPPVTDRKNGIALIVLACLGFVASIWLLIVSRTSEGYTPKETADGQLAMLIIAIAAGITSTLTFMVGYGMRESRRWAFILSLVYYPLGGLISLVTCNPFGLVLSIYVIWYSVVRLCGKKGPVPV